MDPQPSTSQKDVDVFLSPRKKRARKAFTVTEKVMIRNAYKYVKNEISAQSEAFEVVEENEYKIDEFTFSAKRRIVHQFFYRNEPPTITKILQVMNDDPEMPKISKDTLRKILKHLNFKFVARSRKSTLIDRNDIITWRQRTWVDKKIYYQYIRGLRTKLDEFYAGVTSSEADLFAITETGCNKSIHDAEIVPPGYTILRCDRADGRKQGGTCLVATPRLELRRISLPTTVNIDDCVFELCNTIVNCNDRRLDLVLSTLPMEKSVNVRLAGAPLVPVDAYYTPLDVAVELRRRRGAGSFAHGSTASPHLQRLEF
ncbi:hypothetical protein ACJJTC_008518 [Scirpophaga incertulas]